MVFASRDGRNIIEDPCHPSAHFPRGRAAGHDTIICTTSLDFEVDRANDLASLLHPSIINR